MSDKPTSVRDHLAELRRAHVISLAERLGLSITGIRGGDSVVGRRIHLWVTDLQYVTDSDLSPH